VLFVTTTNIIYRYGHAAAHLEEAERVAAGSRGTAMRPEQLVSVKKAWADVYVAQGKYTSALENLEQVKVWLGDMLYGSV
jgi:hypothetical protein